MGSVLLLKKNCASDLGVLILIKAVLVTFTCKHSTVRMGGFVRFRKGVFMRVGMGTFVRVCMGAFFVRF